MSEHDPRRPSLPKLEDFEVQFRRKYGRDLTPEERKFFQFTQDLLEHLPDEPDGETDRGSKRPA